MHREDGFSLASVMVTFVLLMVMGLGMLSLLMSGLQGGAIFEQAMQALHVAEAGLNFGVAQLVSKAVEPVPADDQYAGELNDVTLSRPDQSAQGTFRVTVSCHYPPETFPPACADDPATEAVDERDFRRVVSDGVVPGRNLPARRHLEATVRRYTLAGTVDLFGICGRDGVELGQGTSVIADVGSNGNVLINGPAQSQRTVRARSPRAPLVAPTVEGIGTKGKPGLSGTYTWRVTFIDATGAESAGSPPTDAIQLVDLHARLTGIPIGEGGVTRRRIYRTQADAPAGPWFFVGEIPDNKTKDFTDAQPTTGVSRRLPAVISGNVTAAGAVSCSLGCDTQVEGRVRESVRDVVCPNYLPPPVEPGSDTARDPMIQTVPHEILHLQSLLVPSGDTFAIQTLSATGAELHIHVNDVRLESGAILAVSGTATVYLHVRGTFVLEEGAVFGAIDSDGNLIRPADRIQVMVTARDTALSEGGTFSVQFAGHNKVAAVIFAPTANIGIGGATVLRGALFGKYVRIIDSTGVLLDPNEGLGSAASAIRPSPYQYIVRWYDNPNPTR